MRLAQTRLRAACFHRWSLGRSALGNSGRFRLTAMTARLLSSEEGHCARPVPGQGNGATRLSHRTAALPLTWSSLPLDGSDRPAHRFRSPSDPAVPDQPFTEGRWEAVYTRSQGVGIEGRIAGVESPKRSAQPGLGSPSPDRAAKPGSAPISPDLSCTFTCWTPRKIPWGAPGGEPRDSNQLTR